VCDAFRGICGDARFHFAATSRENATLWWKKSSA
jgi:hypothetical protein